MKAFNKAAVAALLVSTLNVLATPDLPPWLNVSGNINFEVNSSKKNGGGFDSDARIHDAELRFEVLVREGIRLVVKAELENALNKYIKDEDLETKLGQMLEEAYIEIQTDKFGLPQALVTVGKQRMAFGQRLTELDMFRDSLLYKLNNEEEMIGLTVALPANFFKIVDTIAISLYETGAGDMKISADKGVSMQMTKQLSQQLQMQVSALMKQQTGAKNQSRESLGFVYTGDGGAFKVWTEGIVMSHHPQYLDSKYAATVGAALKLGRGVVVLEASTIVKAAREIALAYNLPVGANLILSPEVRYIAHSSGDKETIVGIRARLEFGKAGSSKVVGPR